MADACKTSSQDKTLSSGGVSSPGRSNETVFNTITGDDWRRSIASAKRQSNAVSEQIRTAISSSSPKTK